MDQYVLIGMKNTCSYITLFELADLFGIDNVEKILSEHENDYSKRCREYIVNSIGLYKRKDEIKDREIEISLPSKGYLMKQETKQVLEKIKDFKFFKDKRAVLIGGTALSIHLQHRLSEDLDFMFYNDDKLPKDEMLLFKEKYNAEFMPFDNLTKQEFLNEGGDIEDYQQRFIIDGIKIEFVINTGNILEKDIINENNIEEFEGIPIASLKSLIIMKSLLLVDRNKIRDLYDMVYMMKNNLLTADEFIDIIKKYRLTYDENYILNKLKNKELSIYDEGLENLIGNPPSFEKLKEYLIDKIEKSMIKKANEFQRGKTPFKKRSF